MMKKEKMIEYIPYVVDNEDINCNLLSIHLSPYLLDTQSRHLLTIIIHRRTTLTLLPLTLAFNEQTVCIIDSLFASSLHLAVINKL